MDALSSTQSVSSRTPGPRTRLRNFVFTLNNPTPEEIHAIKQLSVKYIAFAKEHFDDAELTPHLQGFCYIGKQVDFNTVKRYPGLRRAHIERMEGNFTQNWEYITKEDKEPFEKGERPTPGKRNDIHRTVEAIQNGEKISDLVKKDTAAAVVFVKYHRGLRQLESALTSSRTRAPTVVWIYGKTGTGKTRSSVEFAEEYFGEYWISSENLQWFDGAEGKSCVIIDDYRTSFSKFAFLLRILDRYPLSVPVKGGFIKWNPEFIFITTTKSPRDTWNLRTEECLQQLERRLSDIIESKSPGQVRRRIQRLYESTLDSGPDDVAGRSGRLPDTQDGEDPIQEQQQQPGELVELSESSLSEYEYYKVVKK